MKINLKSSLVILLSLGLLVSLKNVFLDHTHEYASHAKLERFDHAMQSMKHFVGMRVGEGETLNFDDYRRADQQLSQIPDMLRNRSQQWQAVGPDNIGGRTRKLVIDTNNVSVLFAAATSGGIWKSIDGGQSWISSFTTYANIATNALAMDPVDSQILYAGTGEGYFGHNSIEGDGIYKTTDGGNSWSHLDSSLINHTVNDIVISYANNNNIYAATAHGVFKSTDGGATWLHEINDSSDGGCLDIEIKKEHHVDYLFVSCGTLGEATIYRNINAMDSQNFWQVVMSGDPDMGRTTLAIAPSNQDVVYALSASNETDPDKIHGLYAVYKTTDNGNSWSTRTHNQVSDKPSRALLSEPVRTSFVECGFGSTNAYSSQGWHNNSITVDPMDENKVWAGGVSLFRSDDAGFFWGLASYWPGRSSDHYVHADIHDIVFHPNYDGVNNTTLFVANDGGIFKTDNPNANVATTANAFPDPPLCGPFFIDVDWQSLNNGYAVTQFNHGAVFPDGDEYWGGTQDNGFLKGSQSTGLQWQLISSGDGSHVEINDQNTDILYANSIGMNFKKSVDGGQSFNRATNGFLNFSALFVNPFTKDPMNQNRLWISSSDYIYRSDDAANSWQRVNSGLLTNTGSALAVSPMNSDLVLVGTTLGGVYKTEVGTTADSSTVWSMSSPRIGHISSLTFNPFNDNEVIATFSTFYGDYNIWKSSDAGESWVAISGNGNNAVPNIPVLSLTYNTLNTDIMFAGTDLGVLITYDGGENWNNANGGVIPKVPVEHITFVDGPEFTGVYAFTYGRSVYRLPVDINLSDLIFENSFE